MGFWWPRGLSQTKGRMEHPVIKSLLTDLGPLTHKYACTLSPEQLKVSTELESKASQLFKTYGSRLWPDADQQRPAWLADADTNNLGGRFPRNLYYSIIEDRDS